MLTLRTLAGMLTTYDEQEARSIVRLLLSDCFGMTFTDICGGSLDRMSEEEQAHLMSLMRRLEEGEPVQYVTGTAEFCGRRFHVEPGVLIPRPETEELCELITSYLLHKANGSESSILDIGTGSGCIAITLALGIPGSQVSAWDISSDALSIAEGNAQVLGASVSFELQDALDTPSTDRGRWDVIVSNPPYICNREAAAMERNVMEHEPHLALFVPDNDPLLFYRSITAYAAHALKDHGMLFFEINPLFANEMRDMLEDYDFSGIEIIEDCFGKKRMAKAIK